MSFKFDLIGVGIYSQARETLKECKEARKEYINYLNLEHNHNYKESDSEIIEVVK